MFILGTARAFGEGQRYMYRLTSSGRARYFYESIYKGMAIHRFVVVASLPATFPTLGRVRPNMTEQAALTRVNLGQQTLIIFHGGLSFEWAGGWVSKHGNLLVPPPRTNWYPPPVLIGTPPPY